MLSIDNKILYSVYIFFFPLSLSPPFRMAVLKEKATSTFMAEAQETINLYVQPGLGKELSVQAYNETCHNYDAVSTVISLMLHDIASLSLPR